VSFSFNDYNSNSHKYWKIQTHKLRLLKWVNSNSQFTISELIHEFHLIGVNSYPTLIKTLKNLKNVKICSKQKNSSGDEIANVNFLYGGIVHVLQNTIDSCINSATDGGGYVIERRFTKFSELTQCNGHYAVQGHSRSPVLVPIESSYTTSY